MTTIQQLLEALLQKGWTIAAISDALGYHRETVSRWHKGSYSPKTIVIAPMLQELLRRKRIPKKKRYQRRPTLPTG